MQTKKLCCGVDVSHLSLDFCYQNNLGELFHLKVGNNQKGFETILEHTGPAYHFVMEATGVYYIRFAFFLHGKECCLSVVNALSIKRYIQMHLERNKSDKKDAAWICRYAIDQRPPYWKMPKALLTLKRNNSIIQFVSTPNKSNGSTTSCIVWDCFPFPPKTRSNHYRK